MSMEQVNILFCNHQSHQCFIGGAEFFLLNLAKSMDGERFKPIFLSNSHGLANGQAFQADLTTHIIEHKMLWEFLAPKRNIANTFQAYCADQRRNIVQIARFIEEKHIQLLVSNCIVNFAPLIAAKHVGIPTILLVHEIIYAFDPISKAKSLRKNLPFFRPNRARQRAVRFVGDTLLEYANTALFVSETSRSKLFSTGEFPERMIKLHPPVRRDIFDSARHQEPFLPRRRDNWLSVAFLGIMVKHKGVHHFLKSATMVLRKTDNVHFTIAGGTPDQRYLRRLKRLARESGKDVRITFFGFRSNPLSVYKFADIVCMTSLYEDPFPGVVNEGMLLGKTVLAYETGSIREMIVDGITGFIIPRGNTKELAKRILFLDRDKETLKAIGKKARKFAREMYDPDEYTANFIRIVEATIEQS